MRNLMLLTFLVMSFGAATADPGRVMVAPQGRSFQFEDGTPFVPIGHTEAFSFFNQVMNDRGTLDRFLADMRAHGQNVIVVQVENNDRTFYGSHPSDLQYPLGTMNEPIARMYDEFLDLAERHGIQVITYLFDTFHMDFNWDTNPWNRKNGGPCTYVSDMLRSRAAIEAQKRTFRWAIDRWGNRTNLMGIELMNEHDWAVAGPLPGNKDAAGRVHGATLAEIRDWHHEMAAFVREEMDRRWGKRPHPLLMSSSNNPNFGRGPDGRPVAAARWFFESPHLDVVAFHGYIWPPPTKDAAAPLDLKARGPTTDPAHPLDALGPIVDAVSYLTRNTDKPVIGTEEGPLGWWIKEPRREPAFPNDDEFFHVMAWGEVTAGAAGPGMRWPYPNFGFGGKPFLNPLTAAMKQALAGMQRILAAVAWDRFAGEHRPGALDAGPGVLTSAVADGEQLIGWLAADTRARRPLPARRRVRVVGLSAGAHEVLWFHDRLGVLLERTRVTGSSFEITSPRFTRSIAMVVRPVN